MSRFIASLQFLLPPTSLTTCSEVRSEMAMHQTMRFLRAWRASLLLWGKTGGAGETLLGNVAAGTEGVGRRG